ncbi:conserved hypothetical protein [Gloeothece citriformis PCC 7424]|uniref:DUF2808 domain-containing protein n=1 Tax=Gloeothece citriformis (strain PCC 7424) TaxID=65393 RepID=B7KJP3_GLOC7|nr:DUF2808 domain-containing protein [Gloeothece citriformis]ACK69492.1 conserved hypothetical protein [Gloeothece citriformis PCC 7424]
MKKLCLLLIALSLNTISLNQKTLAVQLRDGTVAFAKSPRLLNVMTTFTNVGSWSAKYYYTISLPEEAGEPLSQVVIEQREGGERIDYRDNKTFAFVGTRQNRGEPLPLTAITDAENRNLITVKFAPPVQPGQTITIGLQPRQNPWFSGVYLFGVTAYPEGEKSQGMYLGVGRLHFYNPWW